MQSGQSLIQNKSESEVGDTEEEDGDEEWHAIGLFSVGQEATSC